MASLSVRLRPFHKTDRFYSTADMSLLAARTTLSNADLAIQQLETPQNIAVRLMPASTNNTAAVSVHVRGCSPSNIMAIETFVVSALADTSSYGIVPFGFIGNIVIGTMTNIDASDQLQIGTVINGAMVLGAPTSGTVGEVFFVKTGIAAKGTSTGTFSKANGSWAPDAADFTANTNINEYVVVYRDR